MKATSYLIVCLVIVWPTAAASAQEASSREALLSYANTQKQVSQLDWELLEFNLFYHGSYGSGDYLRSYPVRFDYSSMKFKANFGVFNQRRYNDPNPFMSMHTSDQRAVLQDGLDHLVRMLEEFFPPIRSFGDCLEVTFTYVRTGGGTATIATYKNGVLEMGN